MLYDILTIDVCVGEVLNGPLYAWVCVIVAMVLACAILTVSKHVAKHECELVMCGDSDYEIAKPNYYMSGVSQADMDAVIDIGTLRHRERVYEAIMASDNQLTTHGNDIAMICSYTSDVAFRTMK